MMDPDSAVSPPAITTTAAGEEPELADETTATTMTATTEVDPFTTSSSVIPSLASSLLSSEASPPFIWVENKSDVVVLVFGDEMPGVYTGFVDPTHHLPHGPWGTLSYPDGRSYSGAWRLGHWQQQQQQQQQQFDTTNITTTNHNNSEWRIGNATLQLANGDVYVGQTNEQGQRHGCGQYTWSNDGRVYMGFWQSNLRHGQGKYTWTNGAVYEGSFEHGQRQGHGKYTYPDGATYVGEFHQGTYQGHGIFTWPTGRVFSGLWEEGVALQPTVEDAASVAKGAALKNGDATADSTEWEEDDTQEDGKQEGTTKTTTNGNDKSSATTAANATTAASVVPWDDSSCEAVVDKILTDANGFAGSYRGILHKPTKLPHGVGKLQYKHNDWFDSYEGFWDMGKFHGQGTVLFTNGDEYKGEFSQGRRHGQGTYRWTDGRQYDGDFEWDQRTGKGTMSYANTDLYEGDFVNGQRQGQGHFVFADGSAYKGEWNAGKFHGEGELTHPDGRVYRGGFVESAAHGQGVEMDPQGQVVDEGEWIQGEPATKAAKQNTMKHNSANPPDDRYRQQGAGEANKPKVVKQDSALVEECKTVVNGQIWDAQGNGGDYTGIILIKTVKPHGVGRMIYQDGRIHEGFWEQGNRHGHGRCLFQNGDFHEGNYKDNLRNGPGVYRWKDGRVYQGEYVDDARLGKGRFTYPNGDTYNGNFKDGQRHGYGRFEFHEGGFYEGEWIDGKYHGKGKIVFANGQMYEGEFKQGHCHGQGKETDPSGRVRHEGRWDLGDPVLIETSTPDSSPSKATEKTTPVVTEDHEQAEIVSQGMADDDGTSGEIDNHNEDKSSQHAGDIGDICDTAAISMSGAEGAEIVAPRKYSSDQIEAADDGDEPVQAQPRDHYSQDRQAWRRSLDMVNN